MKQLLRPAVRRWACVLLGFYGGQGARTRFELNESQIYSQHRWYQILYRHRCVPKLFSSPRYKHGLQCPLHLASHL